MVNNSESQIFRFTVRTTGLYLSGSVYNVDNLILQYRVDGGTWATLTKGSSSVVCPRSGNPITLQNIKPSWSGSSNNIEVERFPGVPGRGEDNEQVAVLVPKISSISSLEYRVVAKDCPDCWEFFINSTGKQDRALSEPVEGLSACAVVATGSLYPVNN